MCSDPSESFSLHLQGWLPGFGCLCHGIQLWPGGTCLHRDTFCSPLADGWMGVGVMCVSCGPVVKGWCPHPPLAEYRQACPGRGVSQQVKGAGSQTGPVEARVGGGGREHGQWKLPIGLSPEWVKPLKNENIFALILEVRCRWDKHLLWHA